MTSAHAAGRGAAERGHQPLTECDCPDRRRSPLLMAVVVLAPFAAAAVRAADWLTPALSGVLPFRIRIGGGLAVVALLAITALVGTRQRHRVTRPDSAVPIRH